ncbi:hypothetical protein [Rariglobus hedericola]|uniref:Uncharacterized protein n=1 Tax=Rariglobus hedericola TaxID=2597822 RepID=A0A556QGL4_9BACT|nr:hypothetical protein [Rariglobus hedericola]TSJ75778.1 hypothetical protein FPL22_16060 [Rariglobus hedericola]
MLLNSWPVRSLITRAARAYGFLDPIGLLAKMRGFAQPSEVAEPIELLRAGMLFHARGLVNTKAIQNNLDWVWPYWVERQFNPGDESFIPRAFSFSHINLTHRNWTAAGQPDVPFYPIVDPRGLVTPIFDGWSLDFWFVPADPKGTPLFPSRLDDADFKQTLRLDTNLRVHSTATLAGLSLASEVTLCLDHGEPHCCISIRVEGNVPADGFLAVSLRPYNPEGVSFIDKVAITSDRPGWLVNGRNPVFFDRAPSRQLLSVYKDGDVSQRLYETSTATEVACHVSMATAVALFPVAGLRDRPLEIRAPIYDELDPKKRPSLAPTRSWAESMAPLAKLSVPEKRIQELYDFAAANLVLHTPRDAYPGPYTYKRFWFRDAAFMLNALITLGDVERTRRALGEFAGRQRRDGYFLSQEGEWDSNGEAIWIYHRFGALTGETLPDAWREAVAKGARWITGKRLPRDSGKPEAGLLPAGFSAEHLGPNDFYYWDDFWAVSGLRCAAVLLRSHDNELAAKCSREADEFLGTIETSFPAGPQRRFPGAIPASPKRRMDSGAVGSLVADYPLQLFAPADARILKTAEYLRDHSMYGGGFFQNMIHSGINAYLTIHLAQVRLRAGDPQGAWELIDCVASLASPTGQWPEAIHPRTGGGCMGDGQHIWAAAEWLMMIRNCYVREETNALVIGSGVKPAWWTGTRTSFGPTLTPWGAVTVTIEPDVAGGARITLDGQWRAEPPQLDFRLPGCSPVLIERPDHIRTFVLKKLP